MVSAMAQFGNRKEAFSPGILKQVALQLSKPKTWGISDWLAGAIPHLLFGQGFGPELCLHRVRFIFLHSSTIVSVADLTHPNLPVHTKLIFAKNETHLAYYSHLIITQAYFILLRG